MKSSTPQPTSGYPPGYRDYFAHQAYVMIKYGKDEAWMLAFVFNITLEELGLWIRQIDEFADAIERAYQERYPNGLFEQMCHQYYHHLN